MLTRLTGVIISPYITKCICVYTHRYVYIDTHISNPQVQLYLSRTGGGEKLLRAAIGGAGEPV